MPAHVQTQLHTSRDGCLEGATEVLIRKVAPSLASQLVVLLNYSNSVSAGVDVTR